MESDIYFRIIRKLGRYSEKGFDPQSSDEIFEKPSNRKRILLGLMLGIVVILSSFVAAWNRQDSSLITNIYVVEFVVVVLATFSYQSIVKKFSVIIKILALFVSAIFSIVFLNPSTIISLLPGVQSNIFWLYWGIIVFLVVVIVFYVSKNLVGVVDVSVDLFNVLSPIIPTTFGNPMPDLGITAYEILQNEVKGTQAWKEDLSYIIAAAQAYLDSIEMRSLPWVVILGLGFFQNPFGEKLELLYLGLRALLIFIGVIAIFNSARMAYFNTAIIQMGNRLLKEMYLEAEKKQNKDIDVTKDIYFFSGIDKPGCLLGLFLPMKKR